MTLTPGARLGPYEIVAPLGMGGMGEVYRARDTRLSRTVAIKVLREGLEKYPERRERFEREARVVASLTHPHICALHDMGHHDGLDFLVMEYLEGETLAERLAKGALLPEQVLRYGGELADALDQAHRHGVVHRDLKPANVVLTKSGAKLLDFGLAKLREPGSGVLTPGGSALPTEARSLTVESSILGTLQYMAPEQLEAKETDARTDVFALGALIYEMATGQKAFCGKSQASLIAAILTSEPSPMSNREPAAPPALERLVRRCLAKDPEDRWQSARDLFLELRSVSTDGAPAVALRKRTGTLWMAAAIVSSLVALVLGALHLREVPIPAPIRFSVSPPKNATFGSPSISPDGRQLAFRAVDSSGGLLWVRALDSLSARELPGTEDASSPFWSPDSRSIGFFARGKLNRIEASGGPTRALADAPSASGGTWNRDGAILFSPDASSPLYRVAAAGGPVTPVTSLDSSQQELAHRQPQFLPDGRHFLYLALNERWSGALYAGSLDSPERKKAREPKRASTSLRSKGST